MAYNGSVEVISGLKQKNNADFPIVDANAVYIMDGKRLSDIISGLEDKNIKTYIDNNIISQEQRYSGDITNHENRLKVLEMEYDDIGEEAFGNNISVMLVNKIGESIKNELGLIYRLEQIENKPKFVEISEESRYDGYLNVINDKNGQTLAYFDKYGNFHVNGNIYCENW